MLSRDLCAGFITALMVGRSALGSSTRRSRSSGVVRADAGSADDERLVFCLLIVACLFCNSLNVEQCFDFSCPR